MCIRQIQRTNLSGGEDLRDRRRRRNNFGIV